MELRLPQQRPHQVVVAAGPRIRPWEGQNFFSYQPREGASWWRPQLDQRANLVRMLHGTCLLQAKNAPFASLRNSKARLLRLSSGRPPQVLLQARLARRPPSRCAWPCLPAGPGSCADCPPAPTSPYAAVRPRLQYRQHRDHRWNVIRMGMICFEPKVIMTADLSHLDTPQEVRGHQARPEPLVAGKGARKPTRAPEGSSPATPAAAPPAACQRD